MRELDDGTRLAVDRTRMALERTISLMLIVVALITLMMVAVENRREMETMRARYGDLPRSNAVRVAAFVAGFGLFALAAVALGPWSNQ